MPPRWEPLEDDASSVNSSPIQELDLALHEHIRLQRPTQSPLQLYACFQLLTFVGQLNKDIVDSWIRSLFTYFNTRPRISKEEKLQIASLQMEGVAQAWWDTQPIGA